MKPFRRPAYGDIGTEPYTGPYAPLRVNFIEGDGKMGEGALSTPLDFGPGWYRGAAIYYEPFAKKEKAMSSYGSVANVYGPPRAILPVIPPVAGMRDPHGPVYAASYIPRGLPVIMPSKGWRIGPQVMSEIPLGTVEGDVLKGLQMYQRREGEKQRWGNRGWNSRRNYGAAPAYTMSALAEPLIVTGEFVSKPLYAPIQPYMTPVTGYGNAVLDTLNATPYWAVSVASLVGTYLTWDASKRLVGGKKTSMGEKIAVVTSGALSVYSIVRFFQK
jgi:hypothetical protein